VPARGAQESENHRLTDLVNPPGTKQYSQPVSKSLQDMQTQPSNPAPQAAKLDAGLSTPNQRRQRPEKHLTAKHSHAKHCDAKHSHAKHCDAKHSHAKHCDAKHSHAKHCDAKHSHAKHCDAKHSTANAEFDSRLQCWRKTGQEKCVARNIPITGHSAETTLRFASLLKQGPTPRTAATFKFIAPSKHASDS